METSELTIPEDIQLVTNVVTNIAEVNTTLENEVSICTLLCNLVFEPYCEPLQGPCLSMVCL